MKAKIRIAVAIDIDGRWNSSGWGKVGETPREDLMSYAIEGILDGERRYWLEAEIDMPEPVRVIEAVVAPA